MHQGQPKHDVCVSSAVSQGTTVSPRAAAPHLPPQRVPGLFPQGRRGALGPAAGRGCPPAPQRCPPLPPPGSSPSPVVPAHPASRPAPASLPASRTQPRQRCRRSQHGCREGPRHVKGQRAAGRAATGAG